MLIPSEHDSEDEPSISQIRRIVLRPPSPVHGRYSSADGTCTAELRRYNFFGLWLTVSCLVALALWELPIPRPVAAGAGVILPIVLVCTATTVTRIRIRTANQNSASVTVYAGIFSGTFSDSVRGAVVLPDGRGLLLHCIDDWWSDMVLVDLADHTPGTCRGMEYRVRSTVGVRFVEYSEDRHWLDPLWAQCGFNPVHDCDISYCSPEGTTIAEINGGRLAARLPQKFEGHDDELRAFFVATVCGCNRFPNGFERIDGKQVNTAFQRLWDEQSPCHGSRHGAMRSLTNEPDRP